jgi:hypothetical protein
MPDELTNEPSDNAEEEGTTSQEFTQDELAAFERLREDYREIVSTLDEQTRRWREQKGGDRLSQLVNSHEETLRCFDDTDPNIRELAIHLAMEHWKISERIADRCERLAIHDPSSAVRSMAISSLGRCYRNQRNPRVGALLAKIVADPLVAFEERKSAYLALVLVHGGYQRFSISQILLRFPDGIDWGFVNQYLILQGGD